MNTINFPSAAILLNIFGVLPFRFDNKRRVFSCTSSVLIISALVFAFNQLITFRTLYNYTTTAILKGYFFHYLYLSDALCWTCFLTFHYIEKLVHRRRYARVSNDLLKIEQKCRLYSFRKLDTLFWKHLKFVSVAIVPTYIIFCFIHAYSYRESGFYYENLLFDFVCSTVIYFSSLLEISFIYRLQLYFAWINAKLRKPILMKQEKELLIGIFSEFFDVMIDIRCLHDLLKIFQLLFVFILATLYAFYIYFYYLYSSTIIQTVGNFPGIFLWILKPLSIMLTIYFWHLTQNEVSCHS